MNHTADQLNERFGIPGGISFHERDGGLMCAVLSAHGNTATVFAQGAHVTHFGGDGPPFLFLSEQCVYQKGKAIRGGVPIVFPWFGAKKGDPDAAAHGFARRAEWTFAGTDSGAGFVCLRLTLADDDDVRREWPYPFELGFTLCVGDALRMTLETRNSGQEAFTFEAALHTYLAVGDVRRVEITGLERAAYLDQLEGMAETREGRAPLRIRSEIDRIYVGTEATCLVHDPVLDRRIRVEKSGSRSTVIWNPWIDKSRRLGDFGDDEWLRMVCVETSNIGEDAVTLAPGASHVMSATVASSPLS